MTRCVAYTYVCAVERQEGTGTRQAEITATAADAHPLGERNVGTEEHSRVARAAVDGVPVANREASVVLVSTDGWTRIELTHWVTSPVLAANVAITSRFWDRAACLENAQLVDDACASLNTVEFDESVLSRLAREAHAWSSLSFVDLAVTAFVGEYKLATSTGHELTFTFGRAKRPGQTEVRIHGAQERLSFEVRFVADVTGCAALASALVLVLAEPN